MPDDQPSPSSPTTNSAQSSIDSAIDRVIPMVQNIFNSIPSIPTILNSINPLRLINFLLNSIHQLVHSPNTHRSIIGSIIIALTLTLSLAISVIGYLSFYWTYLPHIGFRLPVWLQYGEAKVPYAILDFASLAPEISIDQAYDVSLQLTVPSNDRNMDLGNFMVTFSLVSAPPLNATLHRTSRHASLVYEPSLARVFHAVKYLRTMFFFSSPPSIQNLKIPLLEQRIIQPRSWGKRGKISHAKLQVGRQDVYNPVSPPIPITRPPWGELQVYQANLVFDAHLEGIKWVLYHHPYLSFAFFTSLFLFVEICAVIITWVLVLYRSPTVNGIEQSVLIKSEGDEQNLNQINHQLLMQPVDDEEHKPLRRPISHGMTQVDDSGSEEEHRAVDDEDEHDGEAETLVIKTEDDEDEDDGVLLGGSETTATGRSAFGSGTLTSRTSRTTDAQSYL
ncbi:putative adipose-regulatory protein-domain-containing protein [Phakopsora pachyrhizi]|nr:putative adipose-regulatory protein-domain-containing protein [Phakopsora pachyrhizi]